MIDTNCLYCSKFFSRKISTTQIPKGSRVAQFCSRSCYYEYAKKHKLTQGQNNPSWKGGKVEKTCLICEKIFQHWAYRKNVKCCSMECTMQYRKTTDFKEKISKLHKGRKLSDEQKKKLSESQIGKRQGDLSPSWKGNDVGYRAMHSWVIKVKGKPTICEHCGVDSTKSNKRLVWANKSHKYIRDESDWMRLCYPCHRKYDFPNEKHN